MAQKRRSAEGLPSQIVVIEDDVVVAETLKLYLRHAGYEVDVVRDGIAGLHARTG